VPEFHAEVPHATMSEGLAQVPYVVARAVYSRTSDPSDERRRLYQSATIKFSWKLLKIRILRCHPLNVSKVLRNIDLGFSWIFHPLI